MFSRTNDVQRQFRIYITPSRKILKHQPVIPLICSLQCTLEDREHVVQEDRQMDGFLTPPSIGCYDGVPTLESDDSKRTSIVFCDLDESFLRVLGSETEGRECS